MQIEWTSDLRAADWILDRVRVVGFPLAVASLVPEGFAAYARLPHPARVGSLDCERLHALIEILAAGTRRPDSCWFGVWEGYGWMQGPPAFVALEPLDGGEPFTPEVSRPAPTTPRLTVNDRELVFYRGPIEQSKAFCDVLQSPNLWWPEDRAWCVATEIDFHSTYLGGSDALVETLLADEHVQATLVDPNDRVTD